MKKRSILVALFSLLLSLSIAEAAPLKKEAATKLKELETLISKAKKEKIDVQREDCAVWMAKTFLSYANWDERNVDQNIYQYSTWDPYKEDATKLAKALPDFERQEVIEMLDTAIDELTGVIEGRYSRRTPPVIDWENINPKGNQFYSNGNPVYLNDYFTKTEGHVNEYLGKFNRVSLALNSIKGVDGGISPMGQQKIVDNVDRYSGYVLLWHGQAPSWISNVEPNVADGKRIFTQYDIDNPVIRKSWDSVFREYAPIFKDRKVINTGYILANEPHWHTLEKSWATGGVSSYTMDKFKEWLEQRHCEIKVLNELWGTSFASFADVEITIPIAKADLYTAKGYDWRLFNKYRVTDWFTFLTNSVKSYDPDAKTHIKMVPRMLTQETQDHGLDMEALFEISDIIGNDSKIIKKIYYKKNVERWEKRYALDWSDMAIPYDFFHSVKPDAPNVNSESHFLSSTGYRDIYMTKEFTRTAYWIATLHGMNISHSWFWAREADGSIRQDLRQRRDQVDNAMNNAYVASVVQQPRVANEVSKTYMELNAFGKEIEQFQSQCRPIRLFYSEAANLNKRNKMETTFDLYESLYFEGFPLGFVTRNIINKQDNKLWDVVLVWDIESVREDEIDALQSYLDRGGVVVIDDKSLKVDEYRRPHTKSLTPSNGKLIVASTIKEFHDAALANTEADHLPQITIDESNSVGLDGCLWRAAKSGERSYTLSISNIGKSDATINVGVKGGKVSSMKELFLGQTIENGFTIASEQTLLIEVCTE